MTCFNSKLFTVIFLISLFSFNNLVLIASTTKEESATEIKSENNTSDNQKDSLEEDTKEEVIQPLKPGE